MMKITFLGVGEAFDDTLPNNSHLLETGDTNILFDCGYSIPQQWFKMHKHADFLDAIWLSHQHFDHFGGLPAIIMRMWEEGRTKPLKIFCQAERLDFFGRFIETAYPGFSEKFQYPMEFVGVKGGQTVKYRDLQLSFAPTIHSISNLAVRVDDGRHPYCYSGDGQFTPETEQLYAGSDLVIQETYLFDEQRHGHACIADTISMALRLGVRAVACTHLQRNFRRHHLPKLRERVSSAPVRTFIPEPMDEYIVE